MRIRLLAIGFIFSIASVVFAEEASIKVKDISTQEDTSIVIKKGSAASGETKQSYEIVSGTDDVTGDPEAGYKESYASWKLACENWKKEFKELNKANQVLSLNCNQPTVTKQSNGTQLHKSTANYKMKVLVQETLVH